MGLPTARGLALAFRQGERAEVENGCCLVDRGSAGGTCPSPPPPVFRRWGLGQTPAPASGKERVMSSLGGHAGENSVTVEGAGGDSCYREESHADPSGGLMGA